MTLKPTKTARKITEPEKRSWAVATVDVKPLKGKKKIPPPELPPNLRLKKPIKAVAARPVKASKSSKIYDAKIDLHGLTESAAHQLLLRFIWAELDRGSKRVLVITGKSRAAVLKTNVPRWLDVPSIASKIKNITEAPANAGGSGAYLIRLATAPKQQ